jgi:hypothetical protein
MGIPLALGLYLVYKVQCTFEVMKSIILSAMLLISLAAAQAVDTKVAPAKDKETPCCGSEKVKTSYETKASCPACCKAAPTVKKVALLSPKAADAKR